MSGNTEIIKNRAAVFGLVYVQLIITVVVAFLLYKFCGLVIAYSVLLGGMVYVLPNLCFVRSALKDLESQVPQVILSRFYIGEAQKFLLAMTMFTVCFALVEPLHTVSFFVAYGLIMIINLIGLTMSSQILDSKIN